MPRLPRLWRFSVGDDGRHRMHIRVELVIAVALAMAFIVPTTIKAILN
jgi:hypothetical protein